jgi:hypothetical protein
MATIVCVTTTIFGGVFALLMTVLALLVLWMIVDMIFYAWLQSPTTLSFKLIACFKKPLKTPQDIEDFENGTASKSSEKEGLEDNGEDIELDDMSAMSK